MTSLPRGPLAIGVEALTLTADDIRRLQHPLVGGVVLFTRNFQNTVQLTELTHHIKTLRSPELLISVDHEGGRVQRFREQGFTTLPSFESFGLAYLENPEKALTDANHSAQVMADELIACGVDFSFTPVVDLHNPNSRVIRDRAFHADPKIVIKLATAYIQGMHQQGMKCVIKHFPGHGTVEADTHTEVAIDHRPYNEIEASDLIPFKELIDANLADSVLASHVLYPSIDHNHIVTFSKTWLTDTLKKKLNFKGLIFSDDFGMHALSSKVNNTAQAINQFLLAGGDVALLCNNFEDIDHALSILTVDSKLLVSLAGKWQHLELH